MDCQHCGEHFPDLFNFEIHCKWHSERQAQLQRPKQRQYRDSVHSEVHPSLPSISSPTNSTFSVSSRPSSGHASLTDPDASSSRSGPLDVALGPSFHIGSLAAQQTKPTIPSSSRDQDSTSVRSVEDVLKKFPEYGTDQSRRHGQAHVHDLKCPDCHAVFFSETDCIDHQQSSACPDAAAVAYVMIADAAQPGGYRVERRLLSYDVSQSRIKCNKCKESFGNQESLEAHQTSHTLEQLECVHCQRLFHTATELESHYDWHDDMEFRHHRNKIRAKQPGLKLQSDLGYRDQLKVAMPNFKRHSALSTMARPMPVIHESTGAGSHGPATTTKENDDFMAISFVSAEDLERTHAPNGIFRDPNAEDLHTSLMLNTLPTPRSSEQPEARPTSSEVDYRHSMSSLETKLEANLRPDSPTSSKRASSILNMFIRSKNPKPTMDSVLTPPTSPAVSSFITHQTSSSGHKHQASNDSNTTGADFVSLGAILERVSDKALKGDLAAVKRESDEFLEAPPSRFRPPKQHHVRIHALSSPEGVMVRDVRGMTRILNDQAKSELTSGIRNMPTLSWARAKVRILSTRADLSSEKDDLSDALWCYEQLLDFIKKFPAIFPAAIWHAAILANLADISEQMQQSQKAEDYYVEALNASYSHRGRYDVDNVKLLNALAELCRSTGHLGGAAELFSRVLCRREELGGLDTKESLISMQNFAAMHVKLRNLQVARQLYEKSLDGLEAIAGLDDEVMLSVMSALCDIYVQLNFTQEANALALRALPAMRLVLGPDHSLTRATLTHYLEYTTNFDFDEHIEALLQDYRQHHTDGGLWVLQGLARAYSLSGLQHDAATTFLLVWEARSIMQGPQAYATLDALQGRCLALELMDDIDQASVAYTHLLQLSSRTPPAHEARSRINSTRSRLNSLRMRRNSLEEEKIAWGQQGLGYCMTCKQITNSFCLSCQFFRFCSEECRDRAGVIHEAACHPSVSLCESKSVSTAESVPPRLSRMAVETVQARDIKHRLRTKLYKVAGAFSLSLDSRRFASFRVKLSSAVDTFLMFEHDADIRYAIVDVTIDIAIRPDSVSVRSVRSGQSEPAMPFRWFTPQEQPVLVVPSGREVYLLVSPGQKMLDAIVTKRQITRMGDSADWAGMTTQTFECITYCQGQVVEKKEWERFGHIIEVES